MESKNTLKEKNRRKAEAVKMVAEELDKALSPMDRNAENVKEVVDELFGEQIPTIDVSDLTRPRMYCDETPDYKEATFIRGPQLWTAVHFQPDLGPVLSVEEVVGYYDKLRLRSNSEAWVFHEARAMLPPKGGHYVLTYSSVMREDLSS